MRTVDVRDKSLVAELLRTGRPVLLRDMEGRNLGTFAPAADDPFLLGLGMSDAEVNWAADDDTDGTSQGSSFYGG